MATPKVMNGARAKCYVIRDGEAPVLVGIFNSVSYGQVFDAQAAHILGRYSAAEIDYTAMEPVQISASGWRVVDAGPHTAPGVPLLQQLLSYGYLTFQVEDRATRKMIATIEKVRPTGYNNTIAAKQLTEVSISMMGLLISDETGSQGEDASAADLPA